MAAQKGNTIIIRRSDGGSPTSDATFTAVAGLRAKNVRINNNRIDVTSDDDISGGVSWRTWLSGIIDFEVTGDGVSKNTTTMQNLIDDSINGTEVDYQIEITNIGTFSGPMIVQIEFSGDYQDALLFSGTWSAAGIITYANS